MAFIHWAYNVNTAWVKQERFRSILALCAVLYLASFIVMGYFFPWFAAGSGCSTERTFVTLTFVLTVAVTALQLSPWSPHGALLPSAVMTSYAAYLYVWPSAVCVFWFWLVLSSIPSIGPIRRLTLSCAQVVLGLVVGSIGMQHHARAVGGAMGARGCHLDRHIGIKQHLGHVNGHIFCH